MGEVSGAGLKREGVEGRVLTLIEFLRLKFIQLLYRSKSQHTSLTPPWRAPLSQILGATTLRRLPPL